MRKQLYLLFLLLLSVQLAIAQTGRYEYWLDNDYDARVVKVGVPDEVMFDMDLSAVKPGLHYFNFRTQETSGQWGGLSRYLFYLREEEDATAASMMRYEYWFDDQYDSRTIVNGKTSDVALSLDISSMNPGLHYFNIRAQGKFGQWGGLSRYLFYLREEADATAASMTKYEYWFDNQYDSRMVVDGKTSDVALSLDISSMNPGLHYFNIRAQGRFGQWGGLSRYVFFIREEADATAASMTQ